jgi:hypothetical protein
LVPSSTSAEANVFYHKMWVILPHCFSATWFIE